MTRGRYFLASVLAILLSFFIWTRPAFAQNPQAAETFVEEVEIRGNRRIPRESVLYYVQSKPQDKFDMSLAERDLQAIIQMGLFDPLATKLFVEDGSRGGKVIIFQVKEYPIIRSMEYHGMKSITESDVLDKFKEKHIQVGKEQSFDPVKVNGARLIIRELLAEKGHPEADVSVEVQEISATTVGLVFNVDEGKRVRVKEIDFVGSHDGFSESQLRGAMKLVKEAGLFSNFSSKDIYFKDKLTDDLERVKYFLGTKGYLQAKLGEPTVSEDGKVSAGLPLPLLRKSGPGLKISVPIEVGRRYKIAKIDEKGVSIFQPGIVTAVSGMKVGDWADAKKISENVYKGVKDLYGNQGYIQADVQFVPKFIDKTGEEGDVEVTLEVDEGRQFTLRRLEFIGNNNTRDTVMRRQVLLNEGDAYNKRAWDLSILRLNQLGLFEEIKDKDAITRTNDRDQTVDVDLQVKEKGRQQIQLNGGVSGYQGTFFGIEYSTNNLLGYGETLSVGLTGGTQTRGINFGFTEPYFMGKPISLGFQLFASQYKFVSPGLDFNSQESALLSQYYGTGIFNSDQLFTQNTVGGSISLGGPLQMFTKKFGELGRFTRVQMQYSLSGTTVQDPPANRDLNPDNNVPVTYSQPRIITSRITPSIYYNTKNGSLDPTRGKSLFLGLGISGGALGGDVNNLRPSFEFQYFKPVLRRKSEHPQVLAMRLKADYIRAFGAGPQTQVNDTRSLAFVGGIPIYDRFFLGGDNDIRGYTYRVLGPIVNSDTFASTKGPITATTLDANANSVPYTGPISQSTINQVTFNAPEGKCAAALTSATAVPNCNVFYMYSSPTLLGGDTQIVYNIEYRIPIVSVLTLAAFADVGSAFNSRKYTDQITSSNYIPSTEILPISSAATTGVAGANLTGTPIGVVVDPQGNLVNNPQVDSNGNLTNGNKQVFLLGQSQSYSIVRLAQSNHWTIADDLRSSMGLEFRVQLPVINIPFRLIMAYNPYADNQSNALSGYYGEKKYVVRFSVGRTF